MASLMIQRKNNIAMWNGEPLTLVLGEPLLTPQEARPFKSTQPSRTSQPSHKQTHERPSQPIFAKIALQASARSNQPGDEVAAIICEAVASESPESTGAHQQQEHWLTSCIHQTYRHPLAQYLSWLEHHSQPSSQLCQSRSWSCLYKF